MNDLMMLWRARISSILGIVRAGEAEHREIANMAAQVGADYHGRFIVELLQNASDQACEAQLGQSTVTIIRTAEVVAVANEGMPFTEKGLRSITSLGLTRLRQLVEEERPWRYRERGFGTVFGHVLCHNMMFYKTVPLYTMTKVASICCG